MEKRPWTGNSKSSYSSNRIRRRYENPVKRCEKSGRFVGLTWKFIYAAIGCPRYAGSRRKPCRRRYGYGIYGYGNGRSRQCDGRYAATRNNTPIAVYSKPGNATATATTAIPAAAVPTTTSASSASSTTSVLCHDRRHATGTFRCCTNATNGTDGTSDARHNGLVRRNARMGSSRLSAFAGCTIWRGSTATATTNVNCYTLMSSRINIDDSTPLLFICDDIA